VELRWGGRTSGAAKNRPKKKGVFGPARDRWCAGVVGTTVGGNAIRKEWYRRNEKGKQQTVLGGNGQKGRKRGKVAGGEEKGGDDSGGLWG